MHLPHYVRHDALNIAEYGLSSSTEFTDTEFTDEESCGMSKGVWEVLTRGIVNVFPLLVNGGFIITGGFVTTGGFVISIVVSVKGWHDCGILSL